MSRPVSTSSRSPANWFAAFLLLVTAATHVPLIPEHMEEAPYVGWLFVLLSVVCVVLAAAVLIAERSAVWLLGGATCFAAVVAFLASRTVGLPEIGDEVGNWSEPLGFPALAAEGLMAVLAYAHLRSRTASRAGRHAG